MAFKINRMRFPEGKKKALTLSYDDGTEYDRRLVEMMNRYGVKGTFNLNTALLGTGSKIVMEGEEKEEAIVTAEEIPQLYEKHEVATHAARHISLAECGSAAVCEVLEDRKALESLVPYMVRGHAYPFGIYDKTVLAMLEAAGIRYARTVVSTGAFDLPENFLEWHPTCHHADPRLMELAGQFCEQKEIHDVRLFYLWGHSYEFARLNNWNIMEEFLAYVSGYRDEIWMAVNGEIADYVEAYRGLVFSADGTRVYNPSCTALWLESAGEVYAVPAGKTVVLKGWQ